MTICKCVDHGCPGHPGIDMDDMEGTAMCDRCAEDAIDSGIFEEDSRIPTIGIPE